MFIVFFPCSNGTQIPDQLQEEFGNLSVHFLVLEKKRRIRWVTHLKSDVSYRIHVNIKYGIKST